MSRSTNSNNITRWSTTSLSASVNGPWVEIENQKFVTFHVAWTGGALAGTWRIQTATGPGNDSSGQTPIATPSTLQTGTTYTVSGGLINGESVFSISLANTSFTFARLIWVYTSGTGTLTESYVGTRGDG